LACFCCEAVIEPAAPVHDIGLTHTSPHTAVLHVPGLPSFPYSDCCWEVDAPCCMYLGTHR
jgi:hypothetical protein